MLCRQRGEALRPQDFGAGPVLRGDLARVDTLCLDKTGTITEGTMQVDELVPFEGVTQQEMDAA